MSERRSLHRVLHAGERRADLPYDHYVITDFPPQLAARAPCWKFACRHCSNVYAVNKPTRGAILGREDVLYLLRHAETHAEGTRP